MIRSSIVCLLVGLLGACGCSGKTAPSGDSKPVVDGKGGIVPLSKDGKAAAIAEGKLPLDFVKALNDGKASAAQFSDGFKKSLTPSGFSADDSAQSYLDGLMKNRKFATSEDKTNDAVTIVRGTVSGGDKPEFFTMLIRSGAIDWLHRGPLTATSVPADANWSVVATAVGFWDSLGADRINQASWLLTTAFKADLGPPFASDKDGFNKGAVEAKLRGFRDSLTAYAVATQAITGETATVTGSLTKAGAAQTFTMTLTREAGSGVWKIGNLEVK